MLNRRIKPIPILLFIIAVLAAFLLYDRYTAEQRDAVLQRQSEFEARTAVRIKQLEATTTTQRLQFDENSRAEELELKKLELELKRAEAARVQALVRQKELDAAEREKQRAAQQAEEAAERARMDAETAREDHKREAARQHAAEVRAATLERQDAARRLNELGWKKYTAQRLVTAWRNKLECYQHSKDKAAFDLANAQAQPNGASSNRPPQPHRYDPLGGEDPAQEGSADAQNKQKFNSGGPTVTWITSNREAVAAAQAQQSGAEQAIAEAKEQLTKAQAELTRLNTEYESALTAKQSADRRLALAAPPQPKRSVFATYSLLDGRKLEALCVIESGDDIWIKTGEGVEAIKRAEIEAIVRADEAQ